VTDDGWKKTLARALEAKQAEICAHIEKAQNEGRTTGIEAAFAKAFGAELIGAKFEQNTKPSGYEDSMRTV
jgi:hypothetical protein